MCQLFPSMVWGTDAGPRLSLCCGLHSSRNHSFAKSSLTLCRQSKFKHGVSFYGECDRTAVVGSRFSVRRRDHAGRDRGFAKRGFCLCDEPRLELCLGLCGRRPDDGSLAADYRVPLRHRVHACRDRHIAERSVSLCGESKLQQCFGVYDHGDRGIGGR